MYDPKQAKSLREHIRQTEIAMIESVLKRTHGNVAHAAMMMHIPRPTLIHKMKRYEINARDFGPKPPKT